MKSQKEIGEDFKKEWEIAGRNSTMIFGKDLGGIEFWPSPIVAPYLEFRLRKVANGNELRYKFKFCQTDWYYIYEELMKNARLLNYYF